VKATLADGATGARGLGSATVEEVSLSAGTVRYRDSGSGPVVVFVHGILVNGQLWRNVVPGVEGSARCIVPDWPLGAHSPALSPGADLSPPGVARLIGEFLEALDLQDVTLVGNDTGGALVQLVAADHAARLGRIVLTPCDSFENFLPAMFKGLELSAKVPGGLTALMQSLRFKPARRLPIAFGWLVKHGQDNAVYDEMLGLYYADRGVRRDARKFVKAISKRITLEAAERLRSFDKPALVAWAREDRVFPLAHAERLVDLLPQGRLEIIEDSYSFVPEDQPERLGELIREFVAASAPA
jgi:pimeloyl-ACP methyl ester carboxylesterase